MKTYSGKLPGCAPLRIAIKDCGRKGFAFLVQKPLRWRTLNAVAVWRRGDDEPWLLVTDLAPDWVRCDQYRQRMDEEEAFRDDKTSGFDWDHSRVRNPAHMTRLLLVLQHGYRRVLERTDRRTFGLFSLGLRWLDRARSHLVSPTTSLRFIFPVSETVG